MASIRLQSDPLSEYYYEFDPESSILGRGGMGVVFKGRLVHSDTNKYEFVAIKVLFKDLAEESVLRAKREASIKIVHEHVVRMYDFIETRDLEDKPRYHVISEYLEGETLSEVLKKGSFSWLESLKVTKEILSGLCILHDKGFIHRDIDPSNVMICTEGEQKKTKLIDFGIAKQISEYHNDFQQGTLDGKFIGKVNYASPEQVQGWHWLMNSTSDIYSVGVLLFELITGKLPYTGKTYEIIQGHLNRPVPLDEISSVSEKKKDTEGLRYVIRKATNKDQKRRYQTASEFITDIEKVQKGMSPVPSRIPRWAYIVPGILLIVLGTWIYNDHNNSIYAELLVRANQSFTAAMFDDALKNYEEAYSIRKTDSIASKIGRLKTLTPAIRAYVNSEYAKADSLFKIAATANSSDAYYYLGEMNYEGIGTPKNFKKGFEHTCKAAEMGNKLAEYRLGLIYQNGINMPVDSDKASWYFERAGRIINKGVDANNPELLFVKGNMFMQGNGVSRNEKMAVEYYERAANLGYPQAQYQLYEILDQANHPQAMQWLSKAAKKGYPKAQSKLGDLLIGNKEYREGYLWIQEAAKKNYAHALRKLGAIFQDEVKPTDVLDMQQALEIKGNDSVSFRYLKLAVDYDPDYTRGWYDLAVKSFEFGMSLSKRDRQEAERYFILAQRSIENLPFYNKNGKRVYDKAYPSAEQIRTYNYRALLKTN
ncbi:MAG: protein kinase [Mangrovibacterium sp.]